MISHAFRSEDSLLFKWPYYSKQSTDLLQFLTEHPGTFSTEPEHIVQKFIWDDKRSHIAKTILRKKNNTEGVTLPDFRLSYKAIVIKRAWYWHKKQTLRLTEQRIQKKPTHLQPICEKGAQNTHWTRNSILNK